MAYENKRSGGGKRSFDGPHNGYKKNKFDRPRYEADEHRQSADDETGNGAVIGRNAVRELLKSGRTIDKLLVRRGDREGSIVVLVAEAVERAQPRILVLSFGLNGISRWSRDPEAFLKNYRALIDGILLRSQSTKIVLQSVYPIGENENFSLSVDELNKQIENLNSHISLLAKEYENVDYIIHTACGTTSTEFINSPVEIIDTIINGTKRDVETRK